MLARHVIHHIVSGPTSSAAASFCSSVRAGSRFHASCPSSPGPGAASDAASGAAAEVVRPPPRDRRARARVARLGYRCPNSNFPTLTLLVVLVAVAALRRAQPRAAAAPWGTNALVAEVASIVALVLMRAGRHAPTQDKMASTSCRVLEKNDKPAARHQQPREACSPASCGTLPSYRRDEAQRAPQRRRRAQVPVGGGRGWCRCPPRRREQGRGAQTKSTYSCLSVSCRLFGLQSRRDLSVVDEEAARLEAAGTRSRGSHGQDVGCGTGAQWSREHAVRIVVENSWTSFFRAYTPAAADQLTLSIPPKRVRARRVSPPRYRMA